MQIKQESISSAYRNLIQTTVSNLSNIKTPCYIYSLEQLLLNISLFKKLVESFGIHVHYAVKANNNPTLLKIIAENNIGFDVNSLGELKRIVSLNVPTDHITFAGIGKTDEEIKLSIDTGVGLIKIESLDEAIAISKIATDLQKNAKIALRLNPNIDPKTHPYISTGLATSKFGIDNRDLPKILSVIKENKYLILKGLDAHIGSQVSDLNLYIDVYKFLRNEADNLNPSGFQIEELDLGGGFAISYDASGNSTLKDLYSLFSNLYQMNEKKYRILIEPGRSLVANTGMILTQVLYVKRNGTKNFAIVDAAMTENIRPSLYGAVHPIMKVSERTIKKTEIYDVVGPVCETGDWLGQNVEIESIIRGDYLTILDCGAYTSVMASNYNMRPFATEYLVRLNEISTIREAQSVDDLVKGWDR